MQRFGVWPKASYHLFDDAEIIGIMDGYGGLINASYREMEVEEFSGILTAGWHDP